MRIAHCVGADPYVRPFPVVCGLFENPAVPRFTHELGKTVLFSLLKSKIASWFRIPGLRCVAELFPLRGAPGGPSGRNRRNSVSKPTAYPSPVTLGRRRSSSPAMASAMPAHGVRYSFYFGSAVPGSRFNGSPRRRALSSFTASSQSLGVPVRVRRAETEEFLFLSLRLTLLRFKVEG